MNSKIKIAGAVVAGLIAIDVVGAKVIGSQVEEIARAGMDTSVDKLPIPVRLANYESGWFSSTYDIGVTIPHAFVDQTPSLVPSLRELDVKMRSNAEGMELFFPNSVDHGPFNWTSDGPRFGLAVSEYSLNLDDAFIALIAALQTFSQELNAMFAVDGEEQDLIEESKTDSNLGTIESVTSYTFSGAIETVASYPGGTLKAEMNGVANLTLEPLHMDFSISSGMNKITSELFFGGMSFTSKSTLGQETTIEMGEFTQSSVKTKVSDFIWVGDTTSSMGGMKMTTPLPESNFSVDSTSTIAGLMHNTDDDTVGMRYVVNYDKLVTGEMPIDNIAVDMEITGIPLELADQTLNELLGAYFAVLANDISGIENFGDGITYDQDFSPMLTVNNFNIRITAGDIAGSGEFSLASSLNAQSFEEWQEKFKDYMINAELSINEAAIDDIVGFAIVGNPMMAEMPYEDVKAGIMQQLEALAAQGMLTKTENGYSATISTDENFLIVNGVPIMPKEGMPQQPLQ